MSKVLEKEIYRCTAKHRNIFLKKIAFIMICCCILAWIIAPIVLLINTGSIAHFFDNYYWDMTLIRNIIIIVTFLTIILTLIAFLVIKDSEVIIVLTNKRLYVTISKKYCFIGEVKIGQNYDLSTITTIYIKTMVKHNRCSLTFKTPHGNSPDIIVNDKQFCDCFVDAVNAYHNPAE